MDPGRMSSQEQAEARELLARAANTPDWRAASDALDELMRRLLVLHWLLEAEKRLADRRAEDDREDEPPESRA
jgi:hypothetical protein